MDVGGITKIQIVICIISIFAFLGNTLTILVFVRDKTLLKKSYNAFILFLAIADVLTAILLITSPRFALGDLIPCPTDPFLGEIYCRTIWSRVFLFQLVFFSIYITLLLTVERWVAVVKPTRYNLIFKGKRLMGYVLFCWLWSFGLTGTNLFDVGTKFIIQ